MCRAKNFSLFTSKVISLLLLPSQTLTAECADPLTVKRYKRLSPLVVAGEALGGLGGVQEGDCFVAFSRRCAALASAAVLRRFVHCDEPAAASTFCDSSNAAFNTSCVALPDFACQ